MVTKMSCPGALVRWRGGLLPERSGGCRGRPTIRRARSGWSGRRPATWPQSEGDRAAPDHGSHGRSVPGAETPGRCGGDRAKAREAGVPLLAELGQGGEAGPARDEPGGGGEPEGAGDGEAARR